MNKPKELRKQLRNVVQEILPEVVNEELFNVLLKHLNARLDQIEQQTKETMHQMNERHKDTMGYLVRTASLPAKSE